MQLFSCSINYLENSKSEIYIFIFTCKDVFNQELFLNYLLSFKFTLNSVDVHPFLRSFQGHTQAQIKRNFLSVKDK